MNRRIGKFSLPSNLVKDRSPSVTRIMGACSIWRAEYMMMTDEVEYLASSHHFMELQEGYIAPTYVWVIHEDGSITAED